MSKPHDVQLLIAGDITQDFIIDINGKAHNNVPGGGALYASAGARLFNDQVGIISRTGNKFPSGFLEAVEKRGFNTDGILRCDQNYDQRRMYYWQSTSKSVVDNPVTGYARQGLTFPKELLGYTAPGPDANSAIWKNIQITKNNSLPKEYLDIVGVHLCPINLAAHVKLPTLLLQGLLNTITIAPSDDYMNADHWNQIQGIVKGCTAFFPTENQVRSLFLGKSRDLWEMAEGLAEMGCPFIVILRHEKGFYMYDAKAKKRMIVPTYSCKWVDPTGIEDVFAGAFLGAYKQTYDPQQALLAGNAACSLAVEGSGPFYCLDSIPGLLNARMQMLEQMVVNA